MAAPTTAKFGKMRILIGDGGSPEIYSAPCGLTTKSLTISKNLSEVTIPDCDDPDAPYWLARDVTNMTASISGEGVLAAESEADWNSAAFATESINVRFEIEFSTGTRSYVGAFHIDSFSPTGSNGGRVTASISMQSDGIVTTAWTPA